MYVHIRNCMIMITPTLLMMITLPQYDMQPHKTYTNKKLIKYCFHLINITNQLSRRLRRRALKQSIGNFILDLSTHSKSPFNVSQSIPIKIREKYASKTGGGETTASRKPTGVAFPSMVSGVSCVVWLWLWLCKRHPIFNAHTEKIDNLPYIPYTISVKRSFVLLFHFHNV